jgi:hypothetical protein
MTADSRLRFSDLKNRHPGVTPGLSVAYDEAARVCLDRHHTSPQTFDIQDGKKNCEGSAAWEPTDTRLKNGWNNQGDTTEMGAYGVSLAAVELSRSLVAVSRAETRTGADYYLGLPSQTVEDLESLIRLEVSGTDNGSASTIRERLQQKKNQAKNGKSNLPAIASVVGFAALKIEIEDVEKE